MERPIRILHWYWCDGGGIDRVVRALARRQARNPALRVMLATGRAWTRDDDPHLPPVTALGFRHGLDFLRLGSIRRLLRDTDVLHMHAYNPVVALAARQVGTRVVFTDHHGARRDRTLRNLVMKWLLQRRFVRRAAALVTSPSRFAAAGHRDFYAREVRAVRNGLDATRVRARRDAATVRAEFGLEPDDFVVGTAALFQPCKRIPLLLRIFAEFERMNPHARGRLLVAGDGYGAEELRAEARALGIEGRTVFCGYRRDVHDVVAAMDAFVLPTKGEAFGLAALEAMLLERPVVVFRNGGGLAEGVRHGTTGYIAGTASRAVGYLEAIYRHPRAAREMGARARADARRRFDVSRMERDVHACYEEALGRRPPPAPAPDTSVPVAART